MREGIDDPTGTAGEGTRHDWRASNSGQCEGVRELERLYLRLKAVTLAVAAGVLLEVVDSDLADEAAALVGDARLCEANHPELAVQFAACVAAAEGLDTLASNARGGANQISTEDVEAVRKMHRGVRAIVWELLPCEYTPCSIRHAAPAVATR